MKKSNWDGVILLMAKDYATISKFELLTAECWPAREEKTIKGWLLRAHDGVTARANAVYPYTNESNIELSALIEEAIKFFEERGHPPIFKMTDVCRPEGLDLKLTDLEFEVEMRTHLKIAPIDNLTSISPTIIVKIDETVPSDWFEAYAESSGYSDRAISARRSIIEDIKLRKAFASVLIDGKIAGLGLGVVNNGWLGLFSIVVYSQYRRKGIGTSINQALGSWGKQLGAENAFLQVEFDNHTSIAMYETMGFKTLYDYWYRVRRNLT